MSELTRATPKRSAAALAVFVGLCALVAAVGGAATASSLQTWYRALHKPSFNPPDWVFGPVWTLLYLMVAVAAWRVWRRGGRGRAVALALWGGQLTLNLAWSLIFFGLRAPGPALIDLALLSPGSQRPWPPSPGRTGRRRCCWSLIWLGAPSPSF